MPRIFISCVTAEFGACRVEIAKVFRRVPECDVKTQEDFRQVPEDTIQKLYDYIKDCDAVVHIIGEGAGAIADPKAVASFLENCKAFSPKMKEVGDFRHLQISYTQWEAFLAAYCDIPLFVYQASVPIRDGHPTKACGFDKDCPVFQPQESDIEFVSQHCSRLKLLPTRRYPSLFKDRAELYGHFISDLHNILGPKAHASIVLHDRFGAHKVDELRHVLQTMGAPLLRQGYVLAAFVQISGAIPEVVPKDRGLDLALVDILAERQFPHDLLGFVKACEMLSESLGLEPHLSSALGSWFSEALGALNSALTARCANHPGALNKDLTEAAVMGRCGEALNFLMPDNFPKPTLEIGWRQDAAAPAKRVIPEAYVRWGRYRKQVSFGTLASIAADEGPKLLVHKVRNSKQFQHVRFDRLDVFVSREDLIRPWEYAAGSRPDDEEVQLLPWPTVVRLLDRALVFGETKPPPDPVSRQSLACRLGQCDTFMAEVRERGAFFAARAGDEDATSVFGRAAARASLGFWIRTPKPTELVEECLDALEGVTFATIPVRVFEWKFASTRNSAWRDVTVLYDHPEWPPFEFSDDQFQLSDLELMNRAL